MVGWRKAAAPCGELFDHAAWREGERVLDHFVPPVLLEHNKMAYFDTTTDVSVLTRHEILLKD